jgi:peptide/nickel transport system substrate-binding protein
MNKRFRSLLTAGAMLIALAMSAWAAGPAVKDTVTFAQGSDITSLDPHIGKQLRAFAVTCNMFEQIVKFDEKGNVVPSLAASWQRLSPTQIKFKLRTDVKWHNGDFLSADDVKFSYERMMNTPNVANNIAFLKSVSVLDPHTVVLETKYPYAPVLAALTTPPCAIVPKKVVEADPKAFALHPVGTGPYKFVEWKPDEYCKLEANPDYYGEKAKTKYLVMKVVPESTQRSIMLETGEIDVAYDIPPTDVPRIEKSKKLSLLKGESMKTFNWHFDTKSKGPLGNKLVRQAIAHAIDKNGLVEGVLGGIGRPGVLPVPPAAFGFNDKISDLGYDVKQAKALMKQAGYEKGFDCSVWVEDDQTFTEVCTVIQNQLLEIGINLKIEVMKQATMQNRLYEKQDFDINMSYFNNLVGDADYNLYSNFNPASASNFSYYDNAEVTGLITKSREQFDDKARKAIYDKIFGIIMNDVPCVTLYYDKMCVGVSNKVEGFTLSKIGAHKYASVVVKK